MFGLASSMMMIIDKCPATNVCKHGHCTTSPKLSLMCHSFIHPRPYVPSSSSSSSSLLTLISLYLFCHSFGLVSFVPIGDDYYRVIWMLLAAAMFDDDPFASIIAHSQSSTRKTPPIMVGEWMAHKRQYIHPYGTLYVFIFGGTLFSLDINPCPNDSVQFALSVRIAFVYVHVHSATWIEVQGLINLVFECMCVTSQTFDEESDRCLTIFDHTHTHTHTS